MRTNQICIITNATAWRLAPIHHDPDDLAQLKEAKGIADRLTAALRSLAAVSDPPKGP